MQRNTAPVSPQELLISKQGHLVIGGYDTVQLAEKYGTPLYVIDEAGLRQRCREYVYAFRRHYPHSGVAYAGKAFLTKAMCQLIMEEGLLLDVVSAGELYTALEAGFPAERIFFHGNNKSLSEIEMGVKAGIGRFVVDNIYELRLLDEVSRQEDKVTDIFLRITPGVEAHTHSYIQTGQEDSKFGFSFSHGMAEAAVREALTLTGVNLRGFHCHIGSQIFDLAAFKTMIDIMVEFVVAMSKRYSLSVDELDVGGGLGIRYLPSDEPPSVDDYAKLLASSLNEAMDRYDIDKPLKLYVEPGRSIIGEFGTTLYTIGAIKELPGLRTYVAVDGGMTDNPRVALYQARYEAVVANRAAEPREHVVSIAGKCCESGDMLVWDLAVPTSIRSGDVLAVFSTGAYNFSMASNYNRFPRPAVVAVQDGTSTLWVRRESLEDLVAHDLMPGIGTAAEEAAAGDE